MNLPPEEEAMNCPNVKDSGFVCMVCDLRLAGRNEEADAVIAFGEHLKKSVV